MGALKPFGVLKDLDRATYLDLYYRLLWTLAHRQLMLGQSAIVDSLVRDSVIAEWAKLAKRQQASLIVIECTCVDEELHRRRVEVRKRGIPGWHEISWEHVERMRAEFPPLHGRDLAIDAGDDLHDNLRAVLNLLEYRASA